MRKHSRFTALALLVALSLAGRAVAQEEKEPKKARQEDRIEIDFRGKTLQDLFDIVQTHTGAFFLYPDNLKRKPVYACGVKSLTRNQLVSLFHAILQLHAHTMVFVPVWPGVVIVKVVQSPQGRNYPGPTFSKEEILADPTLLEERQDMVTVIYPLRYAQAMNVQSALRQLIDPRGGTIFGIPNVDVLVLTDFAPSVRRMVEIMNLMDVPGPTLAIELIYLKYAPAEDLLPILNQLASITQAYNQPRQGGQPPRGGVVNFILDERTNAIIVQGSPHFIEKLKKLVAQLDVKLDFEPSRIHIYTLKHTDADDVSATVNELLQSVSFRQLETAYGGLSDQPGLVPPRPGRPRPPVPAPGTGAYGRERERAAAIPDRVTNSIIVVAGEAEYRVIEKVISSLDVRRRQVVIEVVILEVSEDKMFSLGIELTTLDGAYDGSTRGFAATRFGFSNLVDEEGRPIQGPGIPRGQIPGMAPGIMGFHRGKEWRIPAILNLLGSDADVNIMSLPLIVTDDNKEAKLKVMDNRPTASSTSTAAVSNQVGFGGYMEAGTEITITPHISEGNYLRLEIDQSISEFGAGGGMASGSGVVLPPPRDRKEIRNVVTIPDGKTVIIGGLTKRYQTKAVMKIPLLGDIPLIGELFRTTSTHWIQKNFYVFLTPHIISRERPGEYEAMSRAEMAAARSAGAHVDKADSYYRTAFREEREMASAPEGRTHSLMEYRSPRKRYAEKR